MFSTIVRASVLFKHAVFETKASESLFYISIFTFTPESRLVSLQVVFYSGHNDCASVITLLQPFNLTNLKIDLLYPFVILVFLSSSANVSKFLHCSAEYYV